MIKVISASLFHRDGHTWSTLGKVRTSCLISTYVISNNYSLYCIFFSFNICSLLLILYQHCRNWVYFSEIPLENRLRRRISYKRYTLASCTESHPPMIGARWIEMIVVINRDSRIFQLLSLSLITFSVNPDQFMY